MPAQLVNTLPGSRLAAADLFRLTHSFTFGSFLPGVVLDAPGYARQLRDAYPSAGCYAVSALEARPGDKAVVFDVRVRADGAAEYRTVGAWSDALESVDGVALTLTRLEYLAGAGQPAGATSNEAAAERAIATAEATAANVVGGPILDPIKGALKNVTDRLGALGAVLVVAAIVGLFAVTRAKGALRF